MKKYIGYKTGAIYELIAFTQAWPDGKQINAVYRLENSEQYYTMPKENWEEYVEKDGERIKRFIRMYRRFGG